MRCRQCDYPLWNLKARQCPECGTSFTPSEYDFVPHSVQFCCPHCDQAYFGTDERGQPQPRAFQCTNCENIIDVDSMAVRPFAGHEDRATQADHMPWLEREGRPVRAWFATMKWAMVDPGRVIRATPVDTSIGRALLFALVTALIFLIVGQLLPSVLYSTFVSAQTGGFIGWTATYYALGGLGTIVGGIVFTVAYLLIWALLAHGVLRTTGSTPGGFRRTCHSIFYSSGAGVLLAIPCCGFMIGLIWWVVSAAQMVKVSQKAHGGRAALAVMLWPLITMIAMPVLWYAAMMFMVLGAIGGGGFMGPVLAGPSYTQQGTMTMTQAVVMHGSQQTNGFGPDHAIEISLTNAWIFNNVMGGTSVFCDPSTNTTPSDIPIGDTTLDKFIAMNTSQRLGALKAALDAQPANVVGHRVGDYVFVYHGASVNWDPTLWVVVMAPDPDTNPAPLPTDQIHIGTADYAVQSVPYSQFPTVLQMQNQYRATLGLPPLPDPFTITHAKPAVAASSSDAEDAEGEVE